MADVPYPGVWADPRLWLIWAVVLVIITILLIYYKVFLGDKRS